MQKIGSSKFWVSRLCCVYGRHRKVLTVIWYVRTGTLIAFKWSCIHIGFQHIFFRMHLQHIHMSSDSCFDWYKVIEEKGNDCDLLAFSNGDSSSKSSKWINWIGKVQFRYLEDLDEICRIQHDRGGERYACSYKTLSLHYCVPVMHTVMKTIHGQV